MNRNKYNNSLKEDMLGYQSSVNVDALWANIEPQVDAINARNNTRGGLYWFCAIGVVLLAAALFLFPFSQSNTGEELVSSKPVAKEEATKVSANELLEDQTLSAQNNSVSSLTTASLAGTDSKVSTNPSSSSEAEALTTVKPDNRKKKAENTPAALPQKKKASSASSIPPVAMTSEKAGQQASNSSLAGATQKSGPVTQETNVLPSVDQDNTQKLIALGKEFSMLSSKPIFPASTAPRAISTDDLSSYTPNYGLSQKGLSYSVMLQAGIASTGRKLEGAIDTSGNKLLQNRLNSETPLENIQIGVLAGVHHHTGFNVMAGLQYTRITERFENTVTVISRDSVPGIVKLIVLPNGDTIREEGQVPVVTTTTFRKKYYNRYKLIDIPLLLGYEKQINNLRLGLQAGVFANINLSTEGRIFDEESLLVDIGSGQENIFKTSVGLSYYVSFSVGYEMASGITLHFAPYLHHYPGRFTNDDYLLAQKYSLLGIKAGIQYKF